MNRRVVHVAVLVLFSACIIPDRDIRFEGGPGNTGAVRIIEQTPLPAQWRAWCLAADPAISGAEAFCQSTRPSRASGLIAPEQGSLCICPDGQRDLRAPARWTVYAEDPEIDGEESEDTLYGVLLLDPDPVDSDPGAAVAYQNFLPPCDAGDKVEATLVTRERGSSTYATRVLPPESRNTASQWAFRLDDAQGEVIDLCNDDNGTALNPGLHNLQILITDRPFFRASSPTGDGFEREQCGVPDVAAGATYAVANYVFECIDGTLEENEGQCNCEDIE